MAKVDIDELVRRLLADPSHDGHPLREGLSLLWERYLGQVQRLDRIARLSDHVQYTERHYELERTAGFEKRLRKLEKMTRSSDHYQNMLRDMNLALERACTHDPLTELPNRRLLTEQLNQETARSKRQNTPLCVALLDIDYFKHINDNYGHDVGDQALFAVAHAVRDAVRDCDICGRWGGEEFLLLLPSTQPTEAKHVVERIFKTLEHLCIDALPADYRVGVTIGLTAYRTDERPEDAVSRADAAMLQAKRDGRGRLGIGA